MTQTVWKAQVDPEPGAAWVKVPLGAELLFAREQNEGIAVWFRCDPDKPESVRLITRVQTGDPAPSADQGRFLGTACFANGAYVLHVFESVQAMEEIQDSVESAS